MGRSFCPGRFNLGRKRFVAGRGFAHDPGRVDIGVRVMLVVPWQGLFPIDEAEKKHAIHNRAHGNHEPED